MRKTKGSNRYAIRRFARSPTWLNSAVVKGLISLQFTGVASDPSGRPIRVFIWTSLQRTENVKGDLLSPFVPKRQGTPADGHRLDHLRSRAGQCFSLHARHALPRQL